MKQELQEKYRRQIIDKVKDIDYGDFLFMENLYKITDIYCRFVTDFKTVKEEERDIVFIINDLLLSLNVKQINIIHSLTTNMSKKNVKKENRK